MRKRLGSLSLMVVSASLLLAASAWSRPTHSVTHHTTATHSKASRWAPKWMPGHRTSVTGYIFAWINIGSCHSYPDGFEQYVVTGDPETGEITDWADVGSQYPDTETCGVTLAPGLDEAAWDACGGDDGCELWDGHVQGDPDGTSTWTPDEEFCFDGFGCDKRQAGGGVALNAKNIAFSKKTVQHDDVLRDASAWWRTSIRQSGTSLASINR
jgi:hypothetical protein